MTERQRILAVLGHRVPDRVPWATRLDLWLAGCSATGTLPEKYRGAPVMDIYRDLGVGRQSYIHVARTHLRGVELTADRDGQIFLRENGPRLRFPIPTDLVPRDAPGLTTFTLRTPVGSCRVQYATNRAILDTGSLPFLRRHVIHDEADFPVVSWILDHAEVVPYYEPFLESEREIGEHGLTVGMIDRVPFQRILLDFLGEERTFYEMHDEPARFASLRERLDVLCRQSVAVACASPAAMVEMGDNFDGEMTNPRLFARYCVPTLQHAAEALHRVGKVLGSHMDGDMSALVDLVTESGVDVAESFSPEPLSRLTFERAWKSWKGRVIPWGCLPSPLFETQSPQAALEARTAELISAARPGGGIILGIADQALAPTLPVRIRRVGEMIAST